MLTLTGKLINVYSSPGGKNRETGEAYEGASRIQLMVENRLRNGEIRMNMVDLNLNDVTAYRDKIGKDVQIPVGVFVAGGAVKFFYQGT